MADYSAQAATALRLIDLKGRTVTVRRFTDVAPADVLKPHRVGDPTAVNYVIKAAFFPYPLNQSDGVAIQSGDEMCLIAGSAIPDFIFRRGDTIIKGITDDDSKWNVENTEPLQPAEEYILWTLQVRRWPRRMM